MSDYTSTKVIAINRDSLVPQILTLSDDESEISDFTGYSVEIDIREPSGDVVDSPEFTWIDESAGTGTFTIDPASLSGSRYELHMMLVDSDGNRFPIDPNSHAELRMWGPS